MCEISFLLIFKNYFMSYLESIFELLEIGKMKYLGKFSLLNSVLRMK